MGLHAQDCSKYGSHGKLLSYGTAPQRPQTGQKFTVLNQDQFDEAVTGGKFEASVSALGGRMLKTQRGPVCGNDTSFDVKLGFLHVATVTYHGLKCPLAAG